MERKGYRSVKDFQGCVLKDFRFLREWKREDPMAELTPVIPRVDEDKCLRCGVCQTLCPFGAISFDQDSGRVPGVTREYCSGCGWCVGHCPQGAIDCVHVDTGAVIWNGYGTIRDWVE
jgi:MinD superfamily P-loop ATPase